MEVPTIEYPDESYVTPDEIKHGWVDYSRDRDASWVPDHTHFRGQATYLTKGILPKNIIKVTLDEGKLNLEFHHADINRSCYGKPATLGDSEFKVKLK